MNTYTLRAHTAQFFFSKSIVCINCVLSITILCYSFFGTIVDRFLGGRGSLGGSQRLVRGNGGEIGRAGGVTGGRAGGLRGQPGGITNGRGGLIGGRRPGGISGGRTGGRLGGTRRRGPVFGGLLGRLQDFFG